MVKKKASGPAPRRSNNSTCSFLELYSGQAFADEVVAYFGQQGFRLRGVYSVAYSSTVTSV